VAELLMAEQDIVEEVVELSLVEEEQVEWEH
jgi:hypothetical protein